MSHVALSHRAATPMSDDHVLHFDADEFRRDFNQRHFTLQHTLAGHPLFALPRLIELAADMARSRPKDVYYDTGEVGIGQRWEDVERGAFPVDETLRQLHTQRAWIMLWYVDQHPAYGPLLERAMSDVMELTGAEIERQVRRREVILFITSPGRISSYHIDRECNFLLQIQGEKDISVFPRDDREVLPEREIETFWTTDSNAPVYREHLQNRAEVIRLTPGTGVHIPVNAPHWVQNDDNISVSASFNFQFKDHVRANLYRANYYMRRIGLRPTPPFVSPLRDSLKRPVGATLYKARQVLRGRHHRD